MITPPLTVDWPRWRRRLWFFTYVTALGVISNLTTPTPQDVMPFLLGNMAVSVIGQRLGLLWGFITLVLVMLPIPDWPLRLLALANLLAVVLLLRHWRWPLLRAVAAMLVLSLPIIIWAARPANADNLLWALAVATLIATLITNEWGARLVIRVTESTRGRHQPFPAILTNRMAVALAVPLSLAALIGLERFVHYRLDSSHARLQQLADNGARSIQQFLQQHRNVIASHAASLPAAELGQYQRTLEVLGVSYRSFLTLLISNPTGDIVAAYPNTPSPVGRNIADREYFFVPRHTQQPFTSGVFRGRGFGDDIIVAISAPILDRSGAFAGVLEGSLDLSAMPRLLDPLDSSGDSELIVRDAGGRVVYSSAPAFSALADARNEPTLATLPQRPGRYQNGLNRARTHLLANAEISHSHWSLAFRQAYQPLALEFSVLILLAIEFCLLIMIASRQFAVRFSRLLARPLDDLVQRIRHLNLDDPDTLQPLTLTTPIIELQELTADFNQLIARQAGTHAQLRSSLQLLDSLNRELEQRVNERTLELVTARDEAQQLAQVKTAFLANMSHELRTPLTAILGFANQALHDVTLNSESRDSLLTIERNSRYLLELVSDILDASKLEFDKLPLEQLPLSPLALVRNACATVRPRAEAKQIGLQFRPQFPLPERVFGDPTRINQVLFNLLSNAVKFTQQGQVEIELSAEPDGIEWQIVVSDTGIGLTAEQQRRLFQPFAQADVSTTRRFGGSGLGLYISQQLLMRMGGALVLESREGVGTRFTVRLPTNCDPVYWLQVSDAIPELDTPTLTPTSIPTLRGRVLIAEDVDDIRRLTSWLVRRTGADIVMAADGQEARDLALAKPFDLILMDMHMPVLDGRDAVISLRRQGYDRPIVALTADVIHSDVERFTAAGCDQVLSKPINESLLMSVLAQYLPERTATGGTILPAFAAPDLSEHTPATRSATTTSAAALPSTARRSTPAPVPIDSSPMPSSANLLSPTAASPDDPATGPAPTVPTTALLPAAEPVGSVRPLDGHPAGTDPMQQLLGQLSEKFRLRLPGEKQQLLDALASEDWPTVKSVLHKLKGAGGTFGFAEISTVAAQVYRLALAEQWPALRDDMPSLLAVIDQAFNRPN